MIPELSEVTIVKLVLGMKSLLANIQTDLLLDKFFLGNCQFQQV
jgi:hypothetical protein